MIGAWRLNARFAASFPRALRSPMPGRHRTHPHPSRRLRGIRQASLVASLQAETARRFLCFAHAPAARCRRRCDRSRSCPRSRALATTRRNAPGSHARDPGEASVCGGRRSNVSARFGHPSPRPGRSGPPHRRWRLSADPGAAEPSDHPSIGVPTRVHQPTLWASHRRIARARATDVPRRWRRRKLHRPRCAGADPGRRLSAELPLGRR